MLVSDDDSAESRLVALGHNAAKAIHVALPQALLTFPRPLRVRCGCPFVPPKGEIFSSGQAIERRTCVHMYGGVRNAARLLLAESESELRHSSIVSTRSYGELGDWPAMKDHVLPQGFHGPKITPSCLAVTMLSNGEKQRPACKVSTVLPCQWPPPVLQHPSPMRLHGEH